MLSSRESDTTGSASPVPKVIYLLPRMNLASEPLVGVRKKVLGQQLAFQAAGFECEIVDKPSRGSRSGLEGPSNVDQAQATNSASTGTLTNLRSKLLRKPGNALAMLGRLRKAGNAILYVRHTSASPGLILFHLVIRTLPNIKRIYLEIPTWPYRFEHYAKKSDRFLFPLMKFLVHRVVTFTASEEILGLRTFCITNGVSAESNPVSRSKAPQGQAIVLIFVGQLHDWTGIDRMLAGLARYIEKGSELGDVEFHIVGDGDMLTEWRELALQYGLRKQVVFYGSCTGERLDEIYSQSEVAVGNLANHRRKLTCSADLKIREYCMRGIPFVIASFDTAFPSSFEFAKRVPPTDSAISIEELLEFRESVRTQHPDFHKRMREFAMKNLTWETTMSPVFNDMREAFE